ncbi:hypothetical protein DMC14_002720 [Metamycoplasma phocicerebrale]|uniref:Polysaccharide biosynthesis protein C-terminal domain-containing protein n=1 Tax=Metamycoplasma phocicerebrale TaxID=142649 RepID=A0A3Q9V9H2_9BACT|nr:hypothetical protein [Metamycoplasma phocicerebrale]AZZ65682.1 hypothetical protein DMC14_002720 [Metamycoplasma phocicerebrale]
MVLIWFITIPGWKPFFNSVLKLKNGNTIYYLSIISIGFYVTFAYNSIIDSIFYGLGKTEYMLYQSLIVNIVLFGIMFICYKTGAWIPTLNSITLLFAGAIAFDSVITYLLFIWILKKNKINIFSVLKNKTFIDQNNKLEEGKDKEISNLVS